MPKNILFLGFLLAVPAFAAADTPEARLELPEVLRAVHDHDPRIASARANARAADADALAAYAWAPPQLGLQWFGPGAGLPSLSQSSQQQWTLTQELPFFGRTWAQGRVASHQAEAGAADADATEQAEYRDARIAFYSLGGAEFLLKSLDAVSQATHEMARLSGRRAGFGQLDRMGQFMDTMLAMEDSGVEALKPGALQQRRTAEAAIRRLMGLDPLQTLPPASLSVDRLLAEEIPGIDACLKQAEERSPRIREARANLAAAEASRGLAVSGWLPDLTVQGSLTEDDAGMRQGGAMVGIGLPWLWFWRQSGQAAAAKAMEDKARRDLETARLELREQVVTSVEGLHAASDSLRITWTRTYPQASRGLELARTGFRTTALGASEILMAVQDYRSTEENLAGLIAQWGEAQATLDMLIAAPVGALNEGAKP